MYQLANKIILILYFLRSHNSDIYLFFLTQSESGTYPPCGLDYYYIAFREGNMRKNSMRNLIVNKECLKQQLHQPAVSRVLCISAYPGINPCH